MVAKKDTFDTRTVNAAIHPAVQTSPKTVVEIALLIKSRSKSKDMAVKMQNVSPMDLKMEKDPFGRFHAMANHPQSNLVKNANFQIHSAVPIPQSVKVERHGFFITLIGPTRTVLDLESVSFPKCLRSLNLLE